MKIKIFKQLPPHEGFEFIPDDGLVICRRFDYDRHRIDHTKNFLFIDTSKYTYRLF